VSEAQILLLIFRSVYVVIYTPLTIKHYSHFCVQGFPTHRRRSRV